MLHILGGKYVIKFLIKHENVLTLIFVTPFFNMKKSTKKYKKTVLKNVVLINFQKMVLQILVLKIQNKLCGKNTDKSSRVKKF